MGTWHSHFLLLAQLLYYYDYLLLVPEIALVKVCLQNFLVQLKEAAAEHGSCLGFFSFPAEDSTCLRSESFQHFKQ